MNKRIRHGYIQQRSYEWNAHRTRATTFVRTTSVAHMHATGMHAEESTRRVGPRRDLSLILDAVIPHLP